MTEQNQFLGHKARLYFFFFGALWVFVVWRIISATSPQAPALPSEPLTLYYADKQGMFLVPFSVSVAADTSRASDWAQAVFTRLTQPPDSDVVSAVAPGARLLEAVWRKPLWTLRVQLPKESGTTDETLIAGAIARSFLESFPGASQVQLGLLDASGKPYAGQHLDLSQPLTKADLANHLPGASPDGVSVTLWFRLPHTAKLVPIETTLATGSGDVARDAFHQLLLGPPLEAASYLETVVPEGLSPHWEAPLGNVARIDLNRDLPHTPSAQRFIEATVFTLDALPGFKGVQFLADGLPMSGHIGPYDLALPIGPSPKNAPIQLPTAAFGQKTP